MAELSTTREMRNKSQYVLSITVCLLLCSANSFAIDYKGHLKIQGQTHFFRADDVSATIRGTNQQDGYADYRLILSERVNHFSFETHYQFAMLYGDTVAVQSNLAGQTSASNQLVSVSDKTQLLNLTQNIASTDNSILLHRLDRLVANYSSEYFVMSVGRQAVTWGNGFVFNSMDIFNPFSPTAVDKEYKPGDDMVYLQWSLPNNGDLQILGVPRRSAENGKLETQQSSLAAKLRIMFEQADFDFLLAKHYSDDVGAFGITRAVGESIWRFETLIERDIANEVMLSVVSNMDYSWIMFEHNIYGYIEYYGNNQGQKHIDYAALNPIIRHKLNRNEMFVFGQHYVAGAIQVEVTPLTRLGITTIINIADQSTLLPLSVNYSASDNLTIDGGAILSFGARNTEFGGVAVAPASTLYSGPGKTLFVRASFYY